MFLVNTLLLYSLDPYGQTESLMEKQIHSLRVGGRNFFPVVLLCQFLVLAGNSYQNENTFLQKKLIGLLFMIR
jgi:hypothetical protein